jgi:hypothetical protein
MVQTTSRKPEEDVKMKDSPKPRRSEKKVAQKTLKERRVDKKAAAAEKKRAAST